MEQALFNQVVANDDSLTSVMMRSTMDPLNISPVELLIYVLESPLESLVGPHFGNTFGAPGVGYDGQRRNNGCSFWRVKFVDDSNNARSDCRKDTYDERSNESAGIRR